MYLDAFTLSAFVDECMDTLVGGRVQDSVSIDPTSIGLEIYAARRRRYLYLSADSQRPSLYVLDDRLRRGLPRPTQLGLLIRSHVEGGIIMHVSQPRWERVIQFDIDGPEGEVALIVEPMERRANLLLVRDGIIMDCIRRVGADENRVRVSLPAHPYMPPPPQTGKLDPFYATHEQVADALAPGDDPKRKAHQALSGRFLGISPLLAKEIVHRAAGRIDLLAAAADPDAVYTALRECTAPLRDRDWQPGIVERDGVPVAFSVYPITHQVGWHAVEAVSAALRAFYDAPEGEEAYDAAKTPVRAAIAAARAKVEGKLISLRRSMTDDSEREALRQSGELILAYQYAITPGQTELRAQYDLDAPERVIALDPKLTPLENAQRYFDRYNRAKRALDDVPSLIAATEGELSFLDQLATDLELAANYPDIEEVQNALQAGGYWNSARPLMRTGSRSAPLRVVTEDGYVIWVGRNSRQNDQVTFDKGSPLDLWLHARGVPGAHVIIKHDGRRIPESVIEAAAALAAHYSASRSEGKVLVDVTLRRHVKKIKGARLGMVTYSHEEPRTVAPRSAADVTGRAKPDQDKGSPQP